LRGLALWSLGIMHGLGMLGAPFAARLHLGQPGASAHQNFHVVWEALKYFTASGLALAIIRWPLARGERGAWWASVFAVLVAFGGVLSGYWLTGGAPKIDRVSYGVFLLLSIPALLVLRPAPS